ncbi:MAG: methionine adenosyltransferase [Nanoarchaeota archaeon]|nr:methionine adenosyltransferase [Nanoarchaeota archaeon]
MNKKIFIEHSRKQPVAEQSVEIIERKGLGHPDFIADSLAEQFSIALCKEYLKQFGTILHHNVDKLDIVGGHTTPEFRGGTIDKKMLVFFSGRASNEVPVQEIAVQSAKQWIKENFRFLKPDMFNYQVETKSGSSDLKDLYHRRDEIMGANDTSIGLGFAPLTEAENLTLKLEKWLNHPEFKRKHPCSGEDIKVMTLREKDFLTITVAMAMVDKFIDSVQDYKDKKQAVKEEIESFLQRHTTKKFSINLNSADRPEGGKASLYLTVTGTSMEMGDDGAVGRGNRVMGLIPFNRPSSLEAVAGKNPVNHVGKIYNILSQKIAEKISEEVEGIKEVYVRLLSEIGQRIDHPKMASVQIIPEKELTSSMEKQAKRIVDHDLNNIQEITRQVVQGKIELF